MATTVRTDKQLAQRALATADVSTLYTVPSQTCITVIRSFWIANLTAAAHSFSIWMNQGGTQTGDGFALYKLVSLPARSTMTVYCPEGSLILNGDRSHSNASIMAQGDAGSAFTISVYGSEVIET